VTAGKKLAKELLPCCCAGPFKYVHTHSEKCPAYYRRVVAKAIDARQKERTLWGVVAAAETIANLDIRAFRTSKALRDWILDKFNIAPAGGG
jgi:hypothetical protein